MNTPRRRLPLHLRKPLRRVIEEAQADLGGSLRDYQVLSNLSDPYRLDTPAYHIFGKWFLEQMERLQLLERKLHLRGIHYALLGSTSMPNGRPYENTNECWEWLQQYPSKAARWLRYVPFEAITDARNEPPVILVQPPVEPRAYVWAAPDIVVPSLQDLKPQVILDGFDSRQPYRLALYGEKTSLAPVLHPIAERYQADLYLPTGEISDTQMHIMATNAAEDGRPLVVFTLSDFDPSGWQMPISIGRKLQALRDLYFPTLEYELHPIALTLNQAEELDLPSTPLKESEKRADKWRKAMGREQTEIDALATLRPDVLTEIIRQAIKPFYDHELASRVREARRDWHESAQEALDEQMEEEHRAALYERLAEEIETIRDQLAALEHQARLSLEDLNIELPPIEIPEPELDKDAQPKPLISSDWSWTAQTQALRKRKNHDD